MNWRRSIAKALLSGALLLVFWTPFLTFVVAPLLRAQIQDGVCWAASNLVLSTWYDTSLQQFSEALAYNKDEGNASLHATEKANTLLFILFWMTSIVLICGSVYVARVLDRAGFALNLQRSALAMVFISIIELALFSGVAMRYIPWQF
jgi:hypothetical protein